MKNVAAVPSGPTKLNGPYWLLLAATWNLTAVPAGVVAVNESVVHVGGARRRRGSRPSATRRTCRDEAKPGLMYVTKLRSRPPTVVSAAQVEPLVVDVTRWPFAYGLVFEKPWSRSCTCTRTVPLANGAALPEDEGVARAGRQRRAESRT